MGGPSGNLASSMIRNSKDKIVGIVDESCLVYDPEGLDQNTLIKLCQQKVSLSHYDQPLSENGFKVNVED